MSARVTRGVVLLVLAGLMAVTAGCHGTPEADAQVRVDQIGYADTEVKTAMLLAPRDASEAAATVVDDQGRTVFTARVGGRRGTWNAAFPDVHPIDLSGLTVPGAYRIRVRGAVTAESPRFHIGPARTLFGPLVADSVRYFQAHRDGADQLAGPWRRTPAHLDDRAAAGYHDPTFTDDGRMTGELYPTGDHLDAEGGWYDAGDFLKFTHTTAYALIAMLLVQRDHPATSGLAAEIRHGVDWLDKMFDEDTGTLYTQVGIGGGVRGDDGFLGDHDTWRLPQADGDLAVEPGDVGYYLRYRPVFRAAGPGDPLSPNLAGRVAAAFALAAQVEAPTEPVRARRHLATAAQIFNLAETADVGDLVTAQPRSFYPERSWSDDLATGAAELALAAIRLGDPRAASWARQATHWARTNADGTGTAALSVYDLSAVADAELARVFVTTTVTGAEIDTEGLLGDLRTRLDAGVKAAVADPMSAAAGIAGSDYAARQLGYAATALLYRRLSGDGRYDAFGTAQRAVALGANGWGTSLIVGAGTTYPRCLHDQISSLTPATGDPDDADPDDAGGGTPVMAGAVVNGPHTAARFADLPAPSAQSSCSLDAFRPYDRPDARYTDDVRSSASSEPSIDFTATALLAFALTAEAEPR